MFSTSIFSHVLQNSISVEEIEVNTVSAIVPVDSTQVHISRRNSAAS